jgi:hypothetical protein
VTESEIRARITALERALGSGALRVDFADRSTTYRSIDDIKSAITYFSDQLAQVTGTARRKQFDMYAEKGL